MMHIPWEMTAAVGLFFFGIFLIWIWKQMINRAVENLDLMGYYDRKFYRMRLKDIKWYQLKERLRLELWRNEKIKNAKYYQRQKEKKIQKAKES